MATGPWTQATVLQAVSSLTRMQLSPRWAEGWGPWAQQWRCVMVTLLMVWRMTSAVWVMMTMAWGLHLCTLVAMAPCLAWGQALGEWTDEDLGNTTFVFLSVDSHLPNWFSPSAKIKRSISILNHKHCSSIHLSLALRSCEDTLDGDMGGVDPYAWAPMTMERGSMASLDSTLRKGPPGSWRQPELPEVIAMLNYRLDPVKTNAAAFLQHLTFKNDKVKQKSKPEHPLHKC